ncbi:MAG: zinc ribbon domain-containing protein [Lachnospiraceae bacterium]|jgi:hypothetical protein|nr:zinc ribbon domain-containing protein [Lachnospiraceae bacterium]
MYCRNCGEEIQEGAKFCPNCGAQSYSHIPPQAPNSQLYLNRDNTYYQYDTHPEQIANSLQQRQSYAATPKKKSALIPILVSLVIIASAVAIYLFAFGPLQTWYRVLNPDGTVQGYELPKSYQMAGEAWACLVADTQESPVEGIRYEKIFKYQVPFDMLYTRSYQKMFVAYKEGIVTEKGLSFYNELISYDYYETESTEEYYDMDLGGYLFCFSGTASRLYYIPYQWMSDANAISSVMFGAPIENYVYIMLDIPDSRSIANYVMASSVEEYTGRSESEIRDSLNWFGIGAYNELDSHVYSISLNDLDKVYTSAEVMNMAIVAP